MNKNGINKNGVQYLRLDDQTNKYLFTYYVGEGVELHDERVVKNQKEIDNIRFTDLLPDVDHSKE